MFLLKGKLPWQGVKEKKVRAKHAKIQEIKEETIKGKLCEDCPDEFQAYFNYVWSLEYETDPDYDFLRKNFKDLFLRMGYEYDNVYEWTKTVKPKVATMESTV